MARLMVRPAAKPSEGGLGYEYRVAEANGYFSKRVWMRRKRLGLGDSAAMLDAVSSALSAENIDDRFLLKIHQRICPACLKDDRYLRASWDHALFTTCLMHQLKLVADCNQCNYLLLKAPGQISRCTCGADLCDLPAIAQQPTSIEVALSQKWLMREADTKLPLPAALLALSYADFVRVVLLLGCYGGMPSIAKPRKVALKKNSGTPNLILRSAADILEQWPTGFHALLRTRVSQHQQGQTLHKTFGYFYEALYKELAGEQFDFIRGAFEDWISLEWKGQLTKRHRRVANRIAKGENVKPVSAISKQTAIPSRDLADWVARGELRGSIRWLPSGRRAVLIEANQQDKIDRLANRLDLQQASAALGMPEVRLRELLAANCIHGQPPKAGARWQIHISEIERVLGLIKALPIISQGDNRYWSIDTVLRHKLATFDSFAEFVEAIFRNEIACCRASFRAEQGFAAIRVCKTSLTGWQQRHVPGVAVPELAKVLNIKQEVAYHLIRKQIIRAKEFGRLGAFVDETEIEVFCTTYIWARDMAKSSITSARSVIKRLDNLGIAAVVGPSIDGCRQYLFRRDDVANVYE